MQIAILRRKGLDRSSICNKLALFFSSDFVNIDDVSPTRINSADVVIVEFFEANDSELQTLRTRRTSLDSFPLIAIVSKDDRTERQQAEALGFTEIHFAEDGLGKLVKLVRKLGTPRPLYSLSDDFTREMGKAYKKTSAYLDDLQFAGVTSESIPVEMGKEVARELLDVLELDGVQMWLKAVNDLAPVSPDT